MQSKLLAQLLHHVQGLQIKVFQISLCPFGQMKSLQSRVKAKQPVFVGEMRRQLACRVQAGQPRKKKEKMTMGVGESFKFLAASPYIRDLALLVTACPQTLKHPEDTSLTLLWASDWSQLLPI